MTEEEFNYGFSNRIESETDKLNRETLKGYMDVDKYNHDLNRAISEKPTFDNNRISEARLDRSVNDKLNSGRSKENGDLSDSTQEDELRNLSSTLRVSDDDLGRIVSPPTPQSSFLNLYKATVTNNNPGYSIKRRIEMTELADIKESLRQELEQQTILQAALKTSEEDRNDINSKLATLRVKLGVANANYNVSKAESDQLRKQSQEAQIQKARLEERINTSTADLEKLKDPSNPESNINMKKVAANDRKEVKRLRNELEGIKSERSETQKQLEIKDDKIRQLELQIAKVKEQLDTCMSDLDVANISAEAEMKEREEIEIKLNDLIGEKMKFDDRMLKVQSKLDSTASGTTGIQKQVEVFKEKEQKLLQSISTAEKKLRDAVTEIEQLKNRKMPIRTASSIKYHQYRLSRNSMVSDTTPRFSVASKNSMASTGSVGSKATSVASFSTAKTTAASSVLKAGQQKGSSTQTALQSKLANGKTK